MSVLEKNLKNVQNNINNAINKSKRNANDVTLIAVSKTKPVEMLQEIYNLGIREFGENKVQELTDKIEKLPKDINWHMIGHLQTNKVKYIVGKVALIHSVDSIKLAKEIDKESAKKNVITNILIEINVAGEDSKFGSSDMAANFDLIKEISNLHNIAVKGLMTIAPYTEDAESNRQYFTKLYSFAKNEAKEYLPENPTLSMGMTGDYMVAIEEGATLVRVGTGIFGERNYITHNS